MIENRKNDRFQFDEDIMFARHRIHPYCYYGGVTLNYSASGICLMSRYDAPIGDNLCLRLIGKHLHTDATLDELTCMAEVSWSQKLGDNDSPLYYLGLHYANRSTPVLFIPR